MHKVEDDHLITPLLLRRFSQEAAFEGGDPDRYHAFIQKADRSFLTHTLTMPCGPEQRMFAVDMLVMLNKELHHDGAWVICFTDPKPPAIEPGMYLMSDPSVPSTLEYQRFCMIWLDIDGDPQLTMDWVEGESEDELDFSDVLLAGPEAWGDRAETAWQQWRYLMKDVLDPRPEQGIKRAQGQLPSTQH